jgi:predicted RNA-binding protein with PIN domain
MSVHYIIDGYNVLKQLPDLEGRPLKDGRDGLIRYFEIYRPQGSIKNKVTIVFDGKSEVNLPTQRKLKKTNIEIIFSQDETADNKIKKLVHRIPNPKQVIVVTDDRGLKETVKIYGVRVIPVKEIARKKFPKPDEKTIRAKTTLNIEEMEKITKELEEIWLRGNHLK